MIARRPSPRALLTIAVVALSAACSRDGAGAADTTLLDSTLVPDAPAPVSQPGLDTAMGSVVAQASCLVADSAIGPIRLGMTLAEAKRAMPSATFERGFDGDGVASVGVAVGGDDIISVVADGDDADTIAWDNRVIWLETFSRRCATRDSIHPGSLVLDVEKILGAVVKIVRSEIESREYIEFERQPAGLTFRLDYTGRFPEGSAESRSVDPRGRIFSIAVMPRQE